MKKLFLLLPLLLLMSACIPSLTGTDSVTVTINADSKSTVQTLPKDSTVQSALDSAQIKLSSLDRVEPEAATKLTEGLQINVFRGTEEFEVVTSDLPFENQTVKNESMPDGQKVLIQPGVNGKVSTTYRIVKEDGVIASRTVVKTETIEASKPEIVMVGVQSPFAAQPITGRIAYITASNAWVMEGNTGDRRPVVTSGDLDGRIFSISPDRSWLLYSRTPSSSDPNGGINSLWVVNLVENGAIPVPLGVKNVVHYAEWVPNTERTIAYSTVAPRSTPPGWQANNDLVMLQFNSDGTTKKSTTIVEQNSGGIYGWWGTLFAISPDGSTIAYARPDSIGVVDQKNAQFSPLINLTPYQTGGDWAWVPDITWAPYGRILFTVQHGTAGSDPTDETSTAFELTAIVVSSKTVIRLFPGSGMFSSAKPSPLGSGKAYQLGILTSLLPDQSGTSRYDLRLMDRDGSNVRKLYPGEGVQGLSPQQVVWSPVGSDSGDQLLAFLAQGNLMFVDSVTGAISQVSGDGTVSKIDWK
jgi:hypothetical protein